MLEKDFANEFFQRLNARLFGLMPKILRLDPTLNRSIPDYIILCGDNWALLEFKKSKDANKQPNQNYYVQLFNEMSYASFVYPENSEEVINDLERLFKS